MARTVQTAARPVSPSGYRDRRQVTRGCREADGRDDARLMNAQSVLNAGKHDDAVTPADLVDVA